MHKRKCGNEGNGADSRNGGNARNGRNDGDGGDDGNGRNGRNGRNDGKEGDDGDGRNGRNSGDGGNGKSGWNCAPSQKGTKNSGETPIPPITRSGGSQKQLLGGSPARAARFFA